MTYEDLVANPEQNITRIIQLLDINPEFETSEIVPVVEKQADTINQEWRDRFLTDLKDNDPKSYKAITGIQKI